MNIIEQELKKIISEEKKGNYIELSEWYGGKRTGYNGIIVNLDTLEVKEYFSSATFENGKIISNNEINEIGKFNEQGRKLVEEYITNDNIFQFNRVENQVLDAGTRVEIKLDNIACELINCDKTYASNKQKYYDILLNIVKSNISKIEKNNIDINPNVNDDINNNENNPENLIDKINDLDFIQLKELKIKKIEQCYNKVNGINLTETEINNPGFVFWSAKTILQNIKFIDSKIVNKFLTQINEEELNIYINEIELLEQTKFNDIQDVKKLLDKIKN